MKKLEKKYKHKYASFNRPLDFIYPGDISQTFEIKHTPWPLKQGEPFSIIVVEKPLTEDEIYRYELKELD